MAESPLTYLAVDLGAESGRVIAGMLAGGRVELEELHRFPTGGVEVEGGLRWDFPAIFREVIAGLDKAKGRNVRSVSCDSWAVDYVLVEGGGKIAGLPHHYRDGRTEGVPEETYRLVPQAEIYARTGIQFLPFNTIYQLRAELRDNPGAAAGKRFLMIADACNFLLSGQAAVEESNASTTQLYSPATRGWDLELAKKAGIPATLFPPIVFSGTVLGSLLPGVSSLGVQPQVVATCSHDTGAAIAAVPAEGGDWAYLSSGTWSLLGIESAVPILSEAARAANFTNEIGYGGSVRFLKNIVGLWLLQECRRAWAAEGNDLDYAALCREAGEAEPLRSLIHPDWAPFAAPGGMPEKIADYCRATGQPVPATPAQFARAIFDSLALLYAATMEKAEAITGRKIARLHVVGGGSRNAVLNQATADALGRPVLAGPAEASALGNVLLQALALGDLDGEGLSSVRRVSAASFPPVRFEPSASAVWKAARARFAHLSSVLELPSPQPLP